MQMRLANNSKKAKSVRMFICFFFVYICIAVHKSQSSSSKPVIVTLQGISAQILTITSICLIQKKFNPEWSLVADCFQQWLIWSQTGRAYCSILP
jgi:hypothetical protein